MWLAVLELSTGKGVAANAGHEHPALCRANGGFALSVYDHDPPVGLFDDMEYEQHEFKLAPGDSLFVYTDGVAEAINKDKEQFGEERLLKALNLDPSAGPETLLANTSSLPFCEILRPFGLRMTYVSGLGVTCNRISYLYQAIIGCEK